MDQIEGEVVKMKCAGARRKDIIISYPSYFGQFIEDHSFCHYRLAHPNVKDARLFGCPVQLGPEKKISIYTEVEGKKQREFMGRVEITIP